MLKNEEVSKNVAKIFHLLESNAQTDYIGEPISQLEHALQCAWFAQKAKADETLILAALFHDIGHICAPTSAPTMEMAGVLHHEEYGAQYLLDLGFSSTVAQLVRGHVQAKRYLVFKNPTYLQQISPASLLTLQFQGGPMSEQEAQDFEQDPLFEHKIHVRKWDEMAKIKDLKTPSLQSYSEMIFAHLQSSSRH